MGSRSVAQIIPNPGARWGGCSTARSDRFLPPPQETATVPIIQETGMGTRVGLDEWGKQSFSPAEVRIPNVQGHNVTITSTGLSRPPKKKLRHTNICYVCELNKTQLQIFTYSLTLHTLKKHSSSCGTHEHTTQGITTHDKGIRIHLHFCNPQQNTRLYSTCVLRDRNHAFHTSIFFIQKNS
jgi:hypothetical protein